LAEICGHFLAQDPSVTDASIAEQAKLLGELIGRSAKWHREDPRRLKIIRYKTGLQ
jgi:hypothetical protein